MDTLFHIIDDAHVVMKAGGVFYQKKVFIRGDRLFAGWGSGFVRIGPIDSTSRPKVSWESIDLPAFITMDPRTAIATRRA
jgi:hypothetical protein